MIENKRSIVTEQVDICVKVYDPSKKELIAVYNDYAKAAQKLGITPKVLYNRIIFKKRVFSPFLNLEVAVRSSAKKEDEERMIKETEKYGKIKGGK